MLWPHKDSRTSTMFITTQRCIYQHIFFKSSSQILKILSKFDIKPLHKRLISWFLIIAFLCSKNSSYPRIYLFSGVTMFFPWWQCLIASLTVLFCSVNLGCAATLATDEGMYIHIKHVIQRNYNLFHDFFNNFFAVETLKKIAETLGKKNWNFSVDPCSKEPSWFTPTKDEPENQVICDCSFNNITTCHIVRM